MKWVIRYGTNKELRVRPPMPRLYSLSFDHVTRDRAREFDKAVDARRVRKILQPILGLTPTVVRVLSHEESKNKHTFEALAKVYARFTNEIPELKVNGEILMILRSEMNKYDLDLVNRVLP